MTWSQAKNAAELCAALIFEQIGAHVGADLALSPTTPPRTTSGASSATIPVGPSMTGAA
jgi:hypothetical protein